MDLIEDEDFYYDEVGRMVFTASYHLKRGQCCKNGCRHCPYGNAPLPDSSANAKKPG